MSDNTFNSNQNVNVHVKTLTNGQIVSSKYKTKILHKNVVGKLNVLTQENINEANTKYIVKYDYILGENIVVPENCIIEFDGGTISNYSGNNYTFIGSNTKVVNLYNYITFLNVTPKNIITFTGNFI